MNLPTQAERERILQESESAKAEKLATKEAERKRLEVEAAEAEDRYVENKIRSACADIATKVREAVAEGKKELSYIIDTQSTWDRKHTRIAEGVISNLQSPGYRFSRESIRDEYEDWESYGDGEYRSLGTKTRYCIGLKVSWT